MSQETNVITSSESAVSPKVFISYSWSSPGHQEQVRQWAERLLSDGVDVVMDIFDLKEGHDKYHFMEKMVTDPTISHVLVVCDKKYAEKANAKKAGVGTESQIISSEVYGKVDQSKFIPIACEFSEEGEPSLPVFMKSRIWVDFSSLEATNKNWERLIRVLFDKPLNLKPMIGKPPAYLTDAAGKPASVALGKFEVLRHAIHAGTKNLEPYREDFLSTCIHEADILRVRQTPTLDQIELAQKVLTDCGTLKDVRNQIIDWVLLECGPEATADFEEALFRLLENLLELKSNPAGLNSWNDRWFEAHSVFVYETFLYIVAALLKTGSYKTLHEIFKSHYLKPASQRYGEDKFANFGAFHGYSELLQLVLAPPGKRLYCPAAELIKRQADRSDLPFAAVIEAEALVLLSALVTTDIRWYPQTLFYKSRADFPFFVRATQHRHFIKLATIIGVSDANALRTAAKEGYARLNLERYSDFALSAISVWETMNIERLGSLR